MQIVKFKTERDLIKTLFPLLKGDKTYPCVSRLAQKDIEPDIDILNLSYQNKIEGYEVKLLGSDKYGNINRAEFYRGIGEALLYLRYGVERTGLIMGFKNTIKSDEKIKYFIEKLGKEKEIFKRILSNYFSLGVCSQNYIDWIIKADYDFSDYKEKEFLKRLIEEERLSYDKKLLKSISEEAK
jgi:hypothetical protein